MHKSLRFFFAVAALWSVFCLVEINNGVRADEVPLTAKQIKKLEKDAPRIIAKLLAQTEQNNIQRQLDEAYRLADAKHYERAIAILRELVEDKPEFAGVYQNISWLYSEIGQWGNSLEFADSAIDLRPDMSEAHFLRGLALSKLGRLEEARAAYLDTVLTNPQYKQAYNNLGNVELHLNRYEEAVEHYRRAIELEPNGWDAYNGLGEAYRQLGKHREAIAAYRRAIERRADYATAYANLAASHVALEEYDEAAEALARAVRLDPNDAIWRYNLAVICLKLKNRERAMQQRIALQKINAELTSKLDSVIADYDAALVRQLQHVESQLAEALKQHDVVALENLLAEDYVFAGLRRKILSNKPQELEQSSVLLPTAKILSIATDEVSFTPSRNAVLVRGRMMITAELDGESLCGAFQYERIYDYREKRWQLIKEKVAPLYKHKVQKVSCQSTGNYLKQLLAMKR